MNDEFKTERLLVILIFVGGVFSLLTVIGLTWFCCSTTLENQKVAASEVKIRGLRSRLARSQQTMNAAISLRAAGGNQEWAAELDRARALLDGDLALLAQLTSVSETDRMRIEHAIASFDTVSDSILQIVIDDGPDKALEKWLAPDALTQNQQLRRALTTAVHYCDKSIQAVQDAQNERVGQVTAASIGSTAILAIMLLVGIGRVRKHVFRQALVEKTLKTQTAELMELRQLAESASEAKSNFLASTSHELRTPLTTILGFADQLFEDLPDYKERDVVDIIRMRGRGMLQLVNDLLDLAGIESGKVMLELSPTSPWKIVTEVASMMRLQADAKSLVMETTCDSPIPREIHTDPRRLEQILLNLVNNAVKFTDAGFVRIALSYADDSRELSFTVEDSGSGIPEKCMNEVFGPFARGSASRFQEGTGLGLTICQQLSNLLDGTLSVKSKLGAGSTFMLKLPLGQHVPVELHKPEKAIIASPSPSIAKTSVRSSLYGLSVLVVEDDPVNSLMLTMLLKKAGAKVDSCSDGFDAIERVRQTHGSGDSIDLILMDMGLPVVDGYKATQKIREIGFWGSIIALTANVFPRDRRRALKCGCDKVVSKPFDRGKLLKLVLDLAK